MRDDAYPDALPAQYQLHWYALERVLGQGGFGITYLARDTNLDQRVAIKEYLPVDVATRRADATVRARSDDQTERYRWGLDRFIREARTLARFDHPNIVRVLSVFEQHGTAYMVMRFEEGENFAALLDRKRTLKESELMRVLLPVLEGLELVHGAGFIHRDIKPDNIHIRADGSPVLLDFGSARHAVGQSRTMTILVAPGYAPFEQYYSTGEDQGPWTDIYSLGATCYRAISGVPPMDAIARSKGILGSAREILVPATAVGSGRYSERLLKAIDHALAFAEKDRPQTIAAWREELLGPGAAAGTPRPKAAAAPTPAARPAPTPQSAATTAPAPPPNPARGPIARNASIIAGLLVVALVGGGIGAYIALRGAAEPAQPARSPVTLQAPDTAAQKAQAARAKAEAERLAAERDRAEEAARARAEAERIARDKAAAEKAQAEAAARARAEAERIARDKAAAEKAQAEAAARARAEAERIARDQAAADKARAEAVARAKAEAARRAAEKAEAIRLAKLKAAANAAPRSDAESFTYYRDLAHGGDAGAAFTLGEMYEQGRGVAANNNWAYLWYSVAEQRGVTKATSKKEAIAVRLQAVEIEQIDRQVQALVGAAK
jgi:serine/threonine protein kinase